MSNRGDKAFLQDILTAIDDIEFDITGLEFEDFVEVRQVQHAVLFNLQIIGEAANHLDSSLRDRYSSVPWSKAIGMRNVIVHGYFAINLEMVWKTITQDLPLFKPQVTAILADTESN